MFMTSWIPGLVSVALMICFVGVVTFNFFSGVNSITSSFKFQGVGYLRNAIYDAMQTLKKIIIVSSSLDFFSDQPQYLLLVVNSQTHYRTRHCL